jgi:Raf kinase inhibitor-like YbhB/YbcL family protein
LFTEFFRRGGVVAAVSCVPDQAPIIANAAPVAARLLDLKAAEATLHIPPLFRTPKYSITGGNIVILNRHHIVAAAAATLALGLATTTADAAGVLTLKSSTFQDGRMMPKKMANNQANSKNNPNCVGDNVSPQLSWTNVPDGTKSFVLLMVDPEGRGGAGVNHWVAYGIPASLTGFAEGETSKESDKYVGGKSTQGVGFYSGPCTPPGTQPHHYTFTFIATDFDVKDLAPGMTREEVLAKLAAPGQPPQHTKGVAGLVGLFVNPWHR